jgi:hypothetical protein
MADVVVDGPEMIGQLFGKGQRVPHQTGDRCRKVLLKRSMWCLSRKGFCSGKLFRMWPHSPYRGLSALPHFR